MKNHLSEQQFAQCVVAGATGKVRQHLSQCRDCSAQLVAFAQTVSSVRENIRATVDARVAATPHAAFTAPVEDKRLPALQWARLALTAVVVLALGSAPLFLTIHETSEQVSAEALMDSIDAHLSRTVPSPMEPIMSLVPSEESISQPGGAQ
jgi:anti-sigma factor RsiW